MELKLFLKLLLVIYYVVCLSATVYILEKQNKKSSIDGVIGNTPSFSVLMGVLFGYIYTPAYLIIKGVKYATIAVKRM